MKDFNLQELERIMDELGSVPRIFNSEAQFQFELAWKIKEEFDCEVRLEELSRISNGKKDYTDIILEKDGLRIALELKYKTAKYEDESKNIFLKAHGAADLGAYDFLWDVHRIQMLTGVEKSGEDDVKMPCNRGYAIILTNDAHYWKDCQSKETINRDFLIGSGEFSRGVLYKKLHQWYTLDGEIGYSKALQNAPSRQHDIDLMLNYFFQWKNYHTIDTEKPNKEFKYMIVEMAPNKAEENNAEVLYAMKDTISVEIAKRIEEHYGFRWEKCIDLAMSGDWCFKTYTSAELQALDIEALTQQTFEDIDSNKLM